MKKIKIVVLAGLILGFGGLLVKSVTADSSTTNMMEEWGHYLSQNATDSYSENELYAEGVNINIASKDVEQVKTFYVISGMNEQPALEAAIQYVAEREAMYQEAISKGYGVSDEEVWNYIEELKIIIANADNKEDAFAIMSQFDSEEDYWNYEFTVYQKNLPIQNYVCDMEQAFKLKNSNINRAANDVEAEWQEYFEQYKKQLVTEENLQILSE